MPTNKHPQNPNQLYNQNTTKARIALDRYDFEDHIDGYSFRQAADTVDTFPGIDGAENVQTSLNNIADFIASVGGGSLSMAVVDVSAGGVITLTADQAAHQRIKLIGVLPGGVSLIIPPGGSNGWVKAIWNATTGSQVITVKSDLPDAGKVVDQGVVTWLFSDGINVRKFGGIVIGLTDIPAGSNGQVLTTSSGVVGWAAPSGGGGGGSTSPGGSDTQIQFNNAGSFGGTTNATYVSGFFTLGTDLKLTNSGFTSRLASNTLSGNITLTLPGATTTIVGRDTTDTLTNKTINVSNNTLTATSIAAGDLLKSNGTNYVRFPLGAASTVLTVNSSATDASYTTIVNANISSSAAIAVSKLAPGSNGQFLQVSGGVTVWGASPGGGAGSPGGSDTQVQWNNAGAFDGISGAITDGTRLKFTSNPQFINSSNVGTLSWTPTSSYTNSIPDSGSDTFLMVSFPQSIISKSINASLNTINDASAVLGDLFKQNGTKFVRFAKGSANTVLSVNSGGSDLNYATIVDANVSASAAIQGTKISPDFGSQNITTTGALLIGSTPRATIGSLRVANNTTIVAFRDVSNVSDLIGMSSGSSNQLVLGSTPSFTNAATSVVLSSTTGGGLTVSGTAFAIWNNITHDFNIQSPNNFGVLGSQSFGSYGSATGAIYIGNGVAPSANPGAGVILYSNSSILKTRDVSGFITSIGGTGHLHLNFTVAITFNMTNDQASNHILYMDGNGQSSTVVFPTPPDNSSYFMFVLNACPAGNAITLTVAGQSTHVPTIASGTSMPIVVTSLGVLKAAAPVTF